MFFILSPIQKVKKGCKQSSLYQIGLHASIITAMRLISELICYTMPFKSVFPISQRLLCFLLYTILKFNIVTLGAWFKLNQNKQIEDKLYYRASIWEHFSQISAEAVER